MSHAPPDRTEEIRQLLERELPGLAVHSVARAGRGRRPRRVRGQRDLIVRFATEPDRADRARQVHAERSVLATVRDLSPLAVPDPFVVVADDGAMVYPKIPGTPFLGLREHLPGLDLARFGEVIGDFLSRLHQLPLEAVEDFLPREHETLAEWLTDAGEDYARVVDRVPRSLRGPIESFLATKPPPDPQVAACCHNDLGIEHVLVDPATLVVTGIIDWADAAITDPAYDLALLYRDLGAEALTSVLDHYQGPPEPIEDLRLRAEFYARCSVFEDVAYGLDPGHDLYLAQGLSALEHLFGQ